MHFDVGFRLESFQSRMSSQSVQDVDIHEYPIMKCQDQGRCSQALQTFFLVLAHLGHRWPQSGTLRQNPALSGILGIFR